MKRLGSSDTLGGLMSMCPTTDEQSPRNHVYSREFQTILEEEGCVEESGHVAEKKRRLSVDQVKALEKNFEVENKLEPERKVKLAQELGLQPRQVAVWFQNRRARWKTKQLEKDYGLLKANYDALKANYDALHQDNEALLKEIRELKSKLSDENTESNISVKEEVILPESDDDKSPDHPQPAVLASETKQFLNFENRNNSSNSSSSGLLLSEASLLKDGSSDSDSSAILNEENANNNSPINEFILSPLPGKTTTCSSTSLLKFNCPSSLSPPCFQFSRASSAATTTSATVATIFQAQLVKMEEHNLFTSEEACNFFSDEQPPTLQWCCPDQWN